MNTQTTPPDAGILVDVAEVAKICGLSRSAFYKLVSSGRAPKPIKLGRASRWRRQEIIDWIAAGCPHRDRRR